MGANSLFIAFLLWCRSSFSDEKGLADHLKRSKEVLRLAEMVQERHQVPVYFGEFSTMGNHANDIEGMRHFLTLFNQKGYHWSPGPGSMSMMTKRGPSGVCINSISPGPALPIFTGILWRVCWNWCPVCIWITFPFRNPTPRCFRVPCTADSGCQVRRLQCFRGTS